MEEATARINHVVPDPENFTVADLKALLATLPDDYKVTLWHGAKRFNVSWVDAFTGTPAVNLVGKR